MLLAPSAWAATCDSIWPGATTPNSPNAPDLPVFTGSSPLSLDVNLGAGDFHYSTTNISSGTLTTNAATTRLYFNGGLQLSGTASLNPGGDPANLVIIVNGSFQLSGQASINGLIYVTGSASLTGSNNAGVDGAITAAGGISVGGNASVDYDADAVDDADGGGLCQAEVVRAMQADAVCGLDNQIMLTFDSGSGQSLLDDTTAEDVSNYNLSVDGGAVPVITRAVLSDEGHQVLLVLDSDMTNGRNYTVAVSGIEDVDNSVVADATDTFYFTNQENGVVGTYWGNETLTGNDDFQRVDSAINFDWGIFTWPAGSWFNGFSIRWEGLIEPDTSGNFTFRTSSEDGARVWFGEVGSTNQIIDRWVNVSGTQSSAPIALSAGQRYPVVMEFFKEAEAFSSKTAHLQWQLPSAGGFVDVPNANLYTCVDSFVSDNGLVAHYQLEGPTWNGTTGEVIDASYNRLHGTSIGNPASVPAQVCNGAEFDGSNLIRVNDNPLLDLTSELAIMAWIRMDQYAPGDLSSIFSKDENYEFHINPSGQIYWWWQSTRNGTTTRSFDSGSAGITLGNWHHIGIVYSQTRQSIYLDGVEVANRTYSGETLRTNSDPMEIGADQGITSRRWRGIIDEVKLYDRAISGAEVIADMNATNPCASVLDGFEVTAAATASVCTPTDVTIRAVLDDGTTYTGFTGTVNLSTSSNHGNWSASGVSGSLTPDPDSNDDGAVQYTFAADDDGQVVLSLSNTHADTLTVTATENGGTATGESNAITFSENALVISSIDAFADDVIAGRDHQFLVQMLKLQPDGTDCGPFEEYTGDIPLKAWIERGANFSGGLAPDLSGSSGYVSMTDAQPGSNNLTLSFSQGEATTNLRTTDVGEYALNLLDDSSGLILDINNQPVSISGSTDDYVVRPFALDVSAQSQDATPLNNPGAMSYTGDAFVKSGELFDVQVRAVLYESADDNSPTDGFPDAGADLSGNGVTPGFGSEGESVVLSSQLLAPVTGIDPGLAGTTVALSNTFTTGIATTAVRFDEVGIIQLDAALQSGSYLNSGRDVTGIVPYVGRFYPDQFLLEDNDPVLRNGPDPAAWTCGFTYQGQPFGFVNEPLITVTAVNVLGATTANYEGDFWSLPVPSHSVLLDPGSVAAGSACLDGMGAVDAACFDVAISGAGWLSRAAGVGLYSTTSHALTIAKINDQPDAGDVPWNPVVDYQIDQSALTVTETNGDSICYQASGTCAAYLAEDVAGVDLRYGRGWIDNSHGSVQTPLIMTLRLQHWSSANTFVNNTDDNDACLGSLVVDSDFQLADFTGSLNAGETTVAGLAQSPGYALVSLSAPGYDVSGNPNAGRATLRWMLDTDTTDNDPGEECGEHWLCYDFNGDGLRQNPSATAIFGELSDDRPLLFMRESYR